jgi:ABC-2 type transport system permease protein
MIAAFLALLRRDFHILMRHIFVTAFSDQSQSIIWAIVFGIFFPRMHMVSDDFVFVVLPGLVSVTVLMSGINGVLLPLWRDLLGHREIDERLLAPLSIWQVAMEKVAAGTIAGIASGLISIPVLVLIVGQWKAVSPSWSWLFLMMAISSFISAGFGLTVGAMAGARFSSFLFDVVIGPMIFFGCTYYAWEPLRAIGPVRYLMLVNPLVFISEGLRFAMTPQIPHMSLPLLFTGLIGFSVLFMVAGSWRFEKRTIV